MKQVIKEHTFFDDLFGREIVLVDLGAARGEFSFEMSKRYPFAKGILVEPNPTNLKCIPQIPNCVVYPNLIGNNSGELNTFFEDVTLPYNGSKIFPNNNCVEHRIETITLGDIAERNNLSYIDLLKVDVEGTEYEILMSGNDHVFQMCRQITVEFHDFVDVSLKPKTLLILKRFKQMGFEVIANPGHWGFGTDHYDVLFYKQ